MNIYHNFRTIYKKIFCFFNAEFFFPHIIISQLKNKPMIKEEAKLQNVLMFPGLSCDFRNCSQSPSYPQDDQKQFFDENKNQKTDKSVIGRWTKEENMIYKKFLVDNRVQFESEFKRRQNRVFNKLSEALGGKRTSQQCKSHHQKMQLKEKKRRDEKLGKLKQKQEKEKNSMNQLAFVNTKYIKQQEEAQISETSREIANNTDQKCSLYIYLQIDLNRAQMW